MLSYSTNQNISPALESFIKKPQQENKSVQNTTTNTVTTNNQQTTPLQIQNAQKNEKILAGLSLLGVLAMVGIALSKDVRKGGNETIQTVNTTVKNSKIWEDISNCMSIKEMSLPQGLKKAIEKITKTIEKPEIIKERGGRGVKTILLYGPPGTGKTTFAKGIAKHFDNARFAAIDVTSLNSKWVGETEKNVQKAIVEICEEADKNPGTKFFVFIDEIDSIMMEDESSIKKHSNDVLNEFKRCFVDKLGKRDNIITIGATNIPIDVEKGITSAGKKLDGPMLDRFDEKILVDRPNAEQIEDAIANIYKNKKLVNTDIFKKGSEKLKILSEFLAVKRHEVSFRTINSIIEATASSIEDDAKKVDMQDIFDTIVAKRSELKIKYDTELIELAEKLGVKFN